MKKRYNNDNFFKNEKEKINKMRDNFTEKELEMLKKEIFKECKDGIVDLLKVPIKIKLEINKYKPSHVEIENGNPFNIINACICLEQIAKDKYNLPDIFIEVIRENIKQEHKILKEVSR